MALGSRLAGARRSFFRPLCMEHFERRIMLAADFGDAPDTGAGTGAGDYQTASTDSGPSHTIVAGLFMGANVDGDSGTLQNATANADDVDGALPDDEDGVIEPARDLFLTEGTAPRVRVNVTNNTGTAATLYGWIDYNADGLFDNTTERTSVAVPDATTNATAILTFPTVPDESNGPTYARFRLSGDVAASNPTGAANDGEVEDYPVSIVDISDGTVTRDKTAKITHMHNGGPPLSYPSSDQFGRALAPVGDLDGDGVIDLAAGADEDDTGGPTRGSLYVLLMNSDGSAKSYTQIAHALNGGPSLVDGDHFGASIAAIGDLDGNGVTDLAVGAYQDDTGGWDRGAIHVLFMNSNGTVNSTNKIGHLLNGGPSLSNYFRFGRSVTSLGDLDGDGVPDIAVGATGDDTGGTDRGAVHILFLNSDGSAKSTTKIASGSGVTLTDGDFFGRSVGSLADLDGDGVTDLAVGAHSYFASGDNRGAIHVLLMNSDGSVKSSTEIADQVNGGPTLADYDFFGRSVTSIGDLDGDGVPDMAVGADGDGLGSFGAVYLFLMNNDGTAKHYFKIGDSLNGGPDLINSDHFGQAMTFLGDLDADGLPELAVGAWSDESGGFRGAVHTLFLNPAIDFGDAPDTGTGTSPGNYNTLRVDNGPSHAIVYAGLFMGGSVDGDTGTLQNANANADDYAQALPYDEDGVRDPLDLMSTVGTQPTITVQATNNTGGEATLFAWIDYNHDGEFDNATERTQTAVPASTSGGRFTLTFPTIPVGSAGDTYARLRLSTDVSAANPTGGASDGEVEDHRFTIFDVSDGTIASHQKISDTQGGFSGTLLYGDYFGNSVASLGDLDGDGVSDLIVGARGDDGLGVDRGEVWVLFLNGDGTVKSHQKIDEDEGGSIPPLSNLNFFGSSVTSLGDLDGDGITDVAVGAERKNGQGEVYVLFLQADGTVKSYQYIREGLGGIQLDSLDYFGHSITSIGDLDGDGITDLAVGAPYDDDGGADRGALWVLFLNSDGTVKGNQKISATQGGFTGVLDDGDWLASSVTSAGDLDGDGVPDLAVGARGDDDGGSDRGAVWTLFMNTDGTVKGHQKISASQGGFTGVLDDGDRFGNSVTLAGDLDGDGVHDLVSGAFEDDDGGSARGAVWVLFMNTDGTVKAHQKVSDTSGNFVGTLDNDDLFGGSVASLGDLDGDGITDLAVGAFRDDDGGTNRGAMWLLSLDAVDSTPPTLTSFTRHTPATSPTRDDTLIFLATFDEDVTAVDASDFAVSGTTTAAVSGVVPVSASTYQVTVSGGDLANFNGPVGLDLVGGQNITDLSGNPLPAGEPATDETYTVDNDAPEVASFSRLTPSTSPTNADVLIFLVTFDEGVTGIGLSDFEVSGTTTAMVTSVALLSSSSYQVTVLGGNLASFNGTVGLDLSAGQDITDLAGNALPAGEPATDETYLVDNVAPGLTSFTLDTPATSPTNANSLIFRATFDEAVQQVDAADFAVNSTSTAGFTGVVTADAGAGLLWDVTVSGGDLASFNGTVGLNLAGGQNITDLAGNALLGGEPTTDETYTVDNNAPGLTSFTLGTPATPTNANSLTFRTTFDEAVQQVDASDFTVNSTSTAGVTSVVTADAGAGLLWDVTISGGDLASFNGTVGLNLAGGQNVTDLAGNALPAGEPATDETYTVDNDLPGLTAFTLDTPATSPTNADSLIIRATFDEAVQQVDATDFAVNSTGTAGVTSVVTADAGAGLMWDVTVSGGDLASFNGTVGLNLAGGQNITDLAGNALPAGEPATDETYTVDNVAPVLTSFTLDTPATSPTNADSLIIRATFDEAVQQVDAADFAVNSTSTAGVTGVVTADAGAGLMWDVTVSGGDLASFNGTVGLNLAGGQNITDLAGNALLGGEPTTDETYTVDNVAPALTSFALDTPATSPTNADSLVFRATFDEAVQNVDTVDFAVSGTSTAGVTSIVTADAGAGLLWNVTVSGGDLASYNGVVGLNLSTDITDLAGNALPSGEPTTDETYTVDNVAPDLTSVTRETPATSPTNANTLVLRATFDEAVQNVDTADFAVNSTSTAGVTSVVTADAGTGLLWDVTVSGGDLASFNGTVGLNLAGGQNITDLAGNALPSGEPATDETYTVDNDAPALTSFTLDTPATSPTNADTLIFRATFDEAVHQVDSADFVVNGTSTAGITSVVTADAGVGLLWDVTLSGGDLASFNGTVGLNLAGGQNITDLAGNALPSGEPGTDETYTVDNVAPGLTSYTLGTPATTPTNANSLTFRTTFDEAVHQVDASDFTVNGTSTAGVTGVDTADAGVGLLWDVTVSGGDLASFNGTIGLNLAGGQNITDLAGNALPAGEPATDETYLVDNDVPGLTSFTLDTPATSPTNADTLVFQATFDEAVKQVDSADFAVNGTSTAGVTGVVTADAGAGLLWDVTLSGGDLASFNGAVGLNLSGSQNITDLAGNALPASEPATDETYTVDNNAPGLTSFTLDTPATSPTNADSLVFRATFDEAVQQVDTADFAVNSASTAGVTGVVTADAGAGLLWDVTVSGGDLASFNGAVGLNLAGGQNVTDLAGNALPAGEPATDETYLVDNDAPGLTSFALDTPATSPTNADSLIFRATFDEAVQQVDASDFAVNSTSTAGVTSVVTADAGTGLLWDVTVSGGDLASFNGTVGLNLAGGQNITDLAGNALPSGEPATDETYTVDNDAPALTSFTLDTPATSPTNADTLIFRATFDEAVHQVDSADFVVNGTSTAGITSVVTADAGAGLLWDVTLSGGDLASFNGAVGLNLSGSQNITDLAGNALPAGEPGTDETYLVDNDLPGLTAFTLDTPATSPTNADSLIFRVTFDEAVQQVDATDFAVNSTGTAGVTGVVTADTGAGLLWDVTVSGGDLASFNGIVGLNLTGGQNITDLAGNALPVSEPATDETYLVDNDAPALTSFMLDTPATSPTNADSLVFRATFDEAVQNVDTADFSVSSTSTAGVTAVVTADVGAGLLWDVTVSGGDLASFNGAVGLNLAGGQNVTDLAGNALPAGEPATDETFILFNADFGDAPNTYGTLLASNGARHGLGTNLLLGSAIDVELDGQPDAAATGDDLAGVPDDEDGVVFTSLLVPSRQTSVTVIASAAGNLDAWVDFNDDGTWTHPGEQIFATQALAFGPNLLNFTVPAGATLSSQTFARFRFSSAGGLAPTGPAADGEVEDYELAIVELDYGDAPDPTFATLLASNGPRHPLLAGAPRLGASVDGDPDGQQDATAAGDDNDGNNDDDGIVNSPRFIIGRPVGIDVDAPLGGKLDAWLDLDANGVFDHPAEHLNGGSSITLTVGVNTLNFTLPVSAVPGVSFARLRVSTAGSLTPTGLADDGEVEDYAVLIERVFFVNSTGDLGDNNLSDNICDTGGIVGLDPECTLRAAIEQANATANATTGPDKIYFEIPGGGPHAITPAAALPAISEAVIIDGTTQAGYAGTPQVEVDGSGAGAGVHGVTITAGSSSVLGLAINRFEASGILLATGGGNTIQQNMIGTNPTGTTDLGNGSHGVIVFNSPNNVIGGPTTSEANVISGNDVHGVLITRTGSTNNDVKSNIIGLGADGVTALGNDGAGVRIDQGATGNDIGGSGNVISGNASNGVTVFGTGTSNNTVAGNKIGTDITGLVDRGNRASGVVIDGAVGNTVGLIGDGNVISGNTLDGVLVTGAAASGNVVQANLIGLDVTGNAALPNSATGLNIFNAPNNTIGGTAAGAGNVISGNTQNGLFIFGTTASGNKFEGNFIGTNSTGTVAVGNSLFGLVLREAPYNTVGGTVAGARNVISGNVEAGVAILNPAATGNVVVGNLVGTDVTGTVDVGNNNTGVLIWKAPGNRIGGLTAAERNIVSGNDLFGVRISTFLASGNVVQGNYIGADITGTTALPNSDSGVHLANAQDSTIGGTATGARNIISGNGNHGVVLTGAGVVNNRVQGNIIGLDVTGTVGLGNANIGLRIAEGAHDNTIGGATAGAGNVISANGADGVLVIGAGTKHNTVSGNLIGADLTGTVDLGNTSSGVSIIDADTNTIGGTTNGERNVISGNGLFGVGISGAAATGNMVQGNAIGTDITGTVDLGNSSTGVFLSAPSNTIGGTVAGAGNLISGNDFVGVRISGAGASGNSVEGNLIGTQVDATSPLGNTGQGVRIDDGSNNDIGGTAAGAGNVIAHSSSHGVAVVGTATGNAIRGNSMFSNGGLGIDLNLNGVTPNDTPAGNEDVDSGPNNLQNCPVLTLAELDGGGNLVIDYSVPSITTNSAYSLTIEFFQADESNAEGRTKLGQDAYAAADALNTKQVTILAGSLAVGDRIVATATDNNGNTSEFSGNIAVTDVILDVVFGAPSLRENVAQNPRIQLDVNRDNVVSPAGDVLPIINELNRRAVASPSGELPETHRDGPRFLDVNGDKFITPLDALVVINFLNAPEAGEGEAGELRLDQDLPVADGASQHFAQVVDLAINRPLPATATRFASQASATSGADSNASGRSQSPRHDMAYRFAPPQLRGQLERRRSDDGFPHIDNSELEQALDEIAEDVFDTWVHRGGTP